MTVMAVAAALVLATVLIFAVYRRRSYFSELREVLMPDSGRLAVHYTAQTKDDLGVYYHMGAYMERPEVSPAEDMTLSVSWQVPLAYGAADHPVAIAQNGLRNYSRYRATHDTRFLEHATAAADVLVGLQKPSGAWEYSFDFNDLKAGWTSAMAQGEAISLLLRVNQHLPRLEYVNAVHAAYRHLMAPVESGGTFGRFPDGAPMLEEYPNSDYSPNTLNGSIFALWGLRDYALVMERQSAHSAFDELSASLVDRLPLYDTGSWSRYSLPDWGTFLATKRYHRIHIVQLRAMAEITGDTRWSEMAERWKRYRSDAATRSSAALWWQDTRFRLEVLAWKYRVPVRLRSGG